MKSKTKNKAINPMAERARVAEMMATREATPAKASMPPAMAAREARFKQLASRKKKGKLKKKMAKKSMPIATNPKMPGRFAEKRASYFE